MDVTLEHDIGAIAVQQVLHLQPHALVFLRQSVQCSSSHERHKAACQRLHSICFWILQLSSVLLLIWQASTEAGCVCFTPTLTARTTGSSACFTPLNAKTTRAIYQEGIARLVVCDGGVVPGRVEGDHQPRRHAAVQVVLQVLLQPVVLVAALAEVLVRREDGHVHAGHIEAARSRTRFELCSSSIYRCDITVLFENHHEDAVNAKPWQHSPSGSRCAGRRPGYFLHLDTTAAAVQQQRLANVPAILAGEPSHLYQRLSDDPERLCGVGYLAV